MCDNGEQGRCEMKAKDYYEIYKNNPTSKELIGVAWAMFLESKTLIEDRKCKTNSAIFAVMDEIIAKWKAFGVLTKDEGINPNGMESLYASKMSEIWLQYKVYRDNLHTKRIHEHTRSV